MIISNKQTAVEWVIDELYPSIKLQSKYIEEIKEKAKAMEKEQIIKSFVEGNDYGELLEIPKYFAEQYYNKTFGDHK